MQCFKCGKEIPPGSLSCYECGVPITDQKEDLVQYCKEQTQKILEERLKALKKEPTYIN